MYTPHNMMRNSVIIEYIYTCKNVPSPVLNLTCKFVTMDYYIFIEIILQFSILFIQLFIKHVIIVVKHRYKNVLFS